MTTLGIISDTHGLLRPEALAALEGVDSILHAGDIGPAEIITQLEAIAPVHAIHGNIDGRDIAAIYPATATVEIAGRRFHLVHDIAMLNIDPVAEAIDAVIYGHSHHPTSDTRDGVLFFNPGSAGPRRFRLPVTIGIIKLDADRMVHSHRTLKS